MNEEKKDAPFPGSEYKHVQRNDPSIIDRILFFLIWIFLSIITLGIYPFYYFLTRFNEMHEALTNKDD
tara:strand:+ start:262 stop:465 length:204 start_codon:yes stop_codon:yes gene_type:complete